MNCLAILFVFFPPLTPVGLLIVGITDKKLPSTIPTFILTGTSYYLYWTSRHDYDSNLSSSYFTISMLLYFFCIGQIIYLSRTSHTNKKEVSANPNTKEVIQKSIPPTPTVSKGIETGGIAVDRELPRLLINEAEEIAIRDFFKLHLYRQNGLLANEKKMEDLLILMIL